MSDLAGPVQKEIRFSIVMYGGVSLAIYINGVSQEIFKLVRATARKEYHRTGQTHSNEYLISEADLTGSEKVYRKLGEHLRATFVVDILSGTSAGGINAVFLAKALVNNQPFHPLKELWLKEGDIGLLINDKKSLTGLSGFPEDLGSSSLLNSQRMYYKLLEALDDMEKPDSTENYKSPYVGELDLFVTATDLHGLPTPLPVGNPRILENQFRATFRFHYSTIDSAGKDSNDFLRKENPFLAFSARCTSSFPVAFEPMCFSDTERVLASSKFNGRYDYKPERWKRFYKDYADRNFPLQPFGDGGYLDNKPFSYATETLSRRRSDIPVERKMVYIEPAPEIVRLDVESKEVPRPDAIDNTLSAAVFLPRQETIREDLKVIAERNQNVTQINKILQNLTPVTQQVLGRNKTYWRAGGTEWSKQFLGYSIGYFGPSYAFYHQLRVDNTVKELAEAFRRNLNLEENGETAKRLMEAMEKDWRALYYSAMEDGERKSENDLLFRLDLSYRLRRLQFIQQTINQLLAGILALRSQPDVANPIQGYFKISKVDLDLRDGEQEEAFRNELKRIKAAFNDAYNVLRDAGRSLRTRGLGASRIQNFQVPAEYILKVERLGGLINSQAYDGSETGALIEEISLLLFSNNREQPGFLGGKLSESADLCRTALKREDNQKLAVPGKKKFHQAEDAAREIIAHIYKHYEFYDMVTYPVLFGTPGGKLAW